MRIPIPFVLHPNCNYKIFILLSPLKFLLLLSIALFLSTILLAGTQEKP